MTSTRASSRVKRLLGAKKAGHLGTLDPLASGVLPIALGEATKTMAYALEDEKEYRFQIRWGIQTDTADKEGQEIAWNEFRPNKDQIQSCLGKFIGLIEQVPPLYSAIKVNGKRAYELARSNQVVELKKRKIHIKNLVLESVDDKNHATFRVVCGAGTYVRTLAQDIAISLGTLGHVSLLERTRVGKFSLQDAISMEKIEELVHNREVFLAVLPVGVVLDDIPAIPVNDEQRSKVLNGAAIKVDTPLNGQVTLWFEKTLIALAEAQDGLIQPNRVFVY